MRDVLRVSTDLGENSVLFERQLDLLVEIGDEAKFIGVYSADSVDNRTGRYCVRTGRWARSNDRTLFGARDNESLISNYIESRDHTECTIHFSKSEESPIGGLLEKTSATFQKGIGFTSRSRSSPSWKYVAFRFQCTSMPIEQSIVCYPQELFNRDFENLVEEWLVVADYVSRKGICDLPHAAVRVSYDLSMWERLQQFRNCEL
jgi:hypothetical protein